ncbi:MAG: deoxyguanosinetriphosphate triphosphohydrolase [Oscillospiraceae bacterium]|nr:deoxyguanosinetriphosphate triphosphohydrolase [Oscillospiraceae bacterium]
MTVREQTQNIEVQNLSKYACLSQNSKGRVIDEKPCDFRTDFQRDRDRILHSNSFRRLKHKTQVFLSPQGDHYRTRLTHTLEVSQIARTIARALRLNEDLAEAIALGHDLGHTPFGHNGENALAQICDFGFKHYLQSVRCVHFLERYGAGLNLTYEVKNGIACHTKGQQAATLEGRIVRLADKIAYINHDIEDSLRAEILKPEDLPKDCIEVLGQTKSARISTIIKSVVKCSSDDIQMEPQVLEAHLKLREFMFENVYFSKEVMKENVKASAIVHALFEYYIKNIKQLPQFYQEIAENEGEQRAVCDYIAGMTDIFAISQYNELFVPKPLF